MSDILEQKQKLEQLMLSDDLEELNNRTNQFNVFNALKLQNNEIRHSNFLGWLMTPYENHELGDYFLKEFLKSAIKNFSSSKKTEIDLKDVAFANFSDAEIRREYKNIDILVISPQNKFLCVIENKIWTGEHDNQLSRYADIVDKEFNDYKKLYIFLSPKTDEECELIKRNIDATKSVHYIPMCYKQVYEVINKVLKFKSKHLNNEVKIFIEHYQKMIERNIMGNTDREIINLCRKIYRENKEAIDLIFENSDVRAEILELFVEVLKERTDIIDENIFFEGNTVKFSPKGINNTEKLAFGEFSNNMIVSLHSLYWGKKPLYLEIAVCAPKEKTEENYEKRNSLIEHIKQHCSFKKFNGNSDWSYSQSFQLIGQHELESYNGDKEQMKKYLSKKLDECSYITQLKDALNSWQG